jgi:hypothetical protein
LKEAEASVKADKVVAESRVVARELYKVVPAKTRSFTPSPSHAAAGKPRSRPVSPKSDCANVIDDDDLKEKEDKASQRKTCLLICSAQLLLTSRCYFYRHRVEQKHHS